MLNTLWQFRTTQYCSPTADPTLSQPESINIHKLVWPSLMEAALNFSSECTVCAHMLVACGLCPGKTYILDANRHLPKQWSPSLIPRSLKTSRKKTFNIFYREFCQRGRNVWQLHDASLGFRLLMSWKLQMKAWKQILEHEVLDFGLKTETDVWTYFITNLRQCVVIGFR